VLLLGSVSSSLVLRLQGTRHGKLIASQLMDVTVRVAVIRPMATKQMAALLGNTHLQSGSNQVKVKDVEINEDDDENE
jgi:hypothetical protein